MVAFHFPPVQGSSGVHRTLAYSRHLPAQGWQPLVLTVRPNAYPQQCDSQLGQVPGSVPVTRSFALDAARHLAVRGSYLQFSALPDRWASWWPGAVADGLRMIRRHRPALIWSTYPIATAHLIALTLHRLTGLPWVAEFRDGMTDTNYPADPLKRRCYRWIERQTISHAKAVIFASPGTTRAYSRRYEAMPATHWHTIANGYDEDSFVQAQRQRINNGSRRSTGLTLVHSGLLDPHHRDPGPFLSALARLREQGSPAVDGLRVVLRATGFDSAYRQQLQQLRLEDMVFLEPSLPYVEALIEMLDADGLLLFQGAYVNELIPAKLYEYIRAGRPILALTDARGEAAQVIEASGTGTVIPIDAPDAIMQGLVHFVDALRSGQYPCATAAEVARHSRAMRTQELAKVFDTVLAERPAR